MGSRSRWAVVALHDLLWLALVVAPVALLVEWLAHLPEAPQRVTYETAFEPFLDVWAMLLLFGVVGVLLVFLAEFSGRRIRRWARDAGAVEGQTG